MSILTKTFNVGAALAVAIAAAPILTSSPAHAYACKGNSYIGAATKKQKYQAKVKARKSWEAAMKSQFDLSWSVWSIAANKSIQCHKTGTKHACQAMARPCKYVVN